MGADSHESLLATVPAALLQNLRARHAEPARRYHDWSHIAALLGHFRRIEARLHDPISVLYAILYHDAVYDPRAQDNERASAALLVASAPPIPGASLARAHRMILATEGHRLPAPDSGDDGPDTLSDVAHFLDMDLAILGAQRDRFARYEAQIRAEYAHVPDAAFRAGRAAVLARFAERERLYFSPWGQNRFESAARRNLAWSLARLRASDA